MPAASSENDSSHSETNAIQKSESIDAMSLQSSVQSLSIDSLQTELFKFERKYEDLKRKHDAEIAFFLSRLQSIDAPSIYHETFESMIEVQEDKPCEQNAFTPHENQCLGLSSLLHSTSNTIMQAFEKRSDEDLHGLTTLNHISVDIAQNRGTMLKDIQDLQASNSEQSQCLKRGNSHNNRGSESLWTSDSILSRLSARSAPKKKFLSVKKETNGVLQTLVKEVQELAVDKAQEKRSHTELMQEKKETQKLIHQFKESFRLITTNHRLKIRAYDLRYLDARQKSSHLEEANMKLDEIVKSLASTIEAIKFQLKEQGISLS